MRGIAVATLMLGVVFSLAMANPAHGQHAQGRWVGMASSGAAIDSHLHAGFGVAPPADAWMGGELTSPLLRRSFELEETSLADRPNSTAFMVGGALVGALIGSAILFAPSRCQQSESMCGAAIPLYAGGGAAIGGLLGYQYARNSSRTSLERHRNGVDTASP